MSKKSPTQRPPLHFSDEELTLLGKTADALSAYMGRSVLAEIDQNDECEWVIFARALGTDEQTGEDAVHVQMGGPGARMLGSQGGLDTSKTRFDCEFLWAIELNHDPESRFVRLNTLVDVFDS